MAGQIRAQRAKLQTGPDESSNGAHGDITFTSVTPDFQCRDDSLRTDSFSGCHPTSENSYGMQPHQSFMVMLTLKSVVCKHLN